ncbi:uncharacterized protein (DUF1800 family) [Rhizomicrobium palustre]|uniref:Uncharacterized protein (DUF1800 family) n=1 Tax=Rhizomicrobium palustre TaxID=189966 RepID=A0A846MUS7_9PROT|nr:DUF1800 domain-containing protein [Rhizomicrobium palustre]NIK86985.1 uncharacterized protein (DUF1800 family) [Rhizomicrobium palustre]
MSLEGALAVHRFGLGARAGEIASASNDPKAWLLAQLGPADQPTPVLPGSALLRTGQVVADEREFHAQEKLLRAQRKNGQVDDEALKALNKTRYDKIQGELAARFALGFKTERPFAERLVWFWTNHFGVSSANGDCTPYLGSFEREVIRPNIAGKFETMVVAAMRHPAMLYYLNNVQSIGPNSPVGLRSKRGLNENLGRELMELFTLGVDGGYTQSDVIAMAKLLTGFGVDNDGNDTHPISDDGFRFYANRHEPSDVVLRGKTYKSGEEGTIAAITDLARDPSTAHHIAVKFATAFLSDKPTPGMIRRLEENFKQTGGDLRALAETAISDPHAFAPGLVKVRSPVEYVTAAYRLLDIPKAGMKPDQATGLVRSAMGVTRLMGEFPMSAPSPKGWPLESDAWSGPDAVLTRIEWARQIGQRIPPAADVVALAAQGLGPLMSEMTSTGILRASSKAEAVALLIASPEFQRR